MEFKTSIELTLGSGLSEKDIVILEGIVWFLLIIELGAGK